MERGWRCLHHVLSPRINEHIGGTQSQLEASRLPTSRDDNFFYKITIKSSETLVKRNFPLQ